MIAEPDSKPRFIFSFFGIVDFIAFAPFYLAAGIDLRSLRVFRLFRLVRILKLLRYSEALTRFREALSLMKEEIVLFFALCGVLVFVSSVGIYYFENPVQPEVFGSIFDSMWWAVATLTTVGYGDAYPVTVGGKVFTALMLVIGIGVVAVPAGLLASAFSRAARKEVGAAPASAAGQGAGGKSDPKPGT